MRVIWIVLIAFTFAFLAPGNSRPTRNPEEANISPGFPSVSAKRRTEGTTDDFTGTGSYANDETSSNTPSGVTQKGIANRKGNSLPSRNPKVANISPGFPSVSAKRRTEGTTDDFTGTGSYANDETSSNTQSGVTQKGNANRKGNSLPSRNPQVANISPGFPAVSVKRRTEGTTDDFTGTGSYANDETSSNTPSGATQKGIANRKGNSGPSGNPEVANISPGFPSESAKHRHVETTDDFTGTGPDANDKPSSNTPSGVTQKGIANRKGNSRPSRNPKVAYISPGFASDSVKLRPEVPTDDFTGTGSYANDKPSSNTQSWGTQKRIANRKGNSLPSRNPKVAYTSPGFASGSVKHRPQGTTDDFTGTDSYPASGRHPSNTPSPWGELNQLLKLKHIGFGKHFFKKASALLKSRPEIYASFKKELEDANHQSSKGNPRAPDSSEHESETNEVPGSDNDWDSGEPEDMEPNSEADKMSGSGTDWDSREPENPESESYERSRSNTDWKSNEPEDEDEPDEQLRSDNDKDSGEPENLDSETVAHELSGWDTDWDSGGLEDKDSESDKVEISGSATDLDYNDPEDQDSESEANEQLRSDTDKDSEDLQNRDPDSEAQELSGWDTGKPDDKDSESGQVEISGSDNDLDSGKPDYEDSETETDKQFRSDTDWDSGEPEDDDSELESSEQSRSDTDWDSGENEHEDPESEAEDLSGWHTDWDSSEPEDRGSGSETSEQSRSDTDWDSGEPEDDDSELESAKQSRSDTDWDSGKFEDEDPESEAEDLTGSDTGDSESETSEQSGSDNDWNSGEPESDTDKLTSDTEWDTQNLNFQDSAISSELNKLFKLKDINLGKHLSKKVAHLLKSRPTLSAYFREELNDASHHSPNVKIADLHDLPKSLHGTSMKANEQFQEIYSQVITSAPEHMGPRSKTYKLPSDIQWGPGGPEDEKFESEADKVPLSVSKWDAGSLQTLEPELEHNVLSSPDVESGTGETAGAAESKVVPARRSHRSSQNNQKTVPSVEAPEQDTIKKEKGHVPIKRPNTVFTKTIPSVGQVFETQKANGLTQHISRKVAKMLAWSGSSWSGIPMPQGRNGVLNLNIRLDSLGNQGLRTKKTKGHKSEKESEGAIVRVLVTLFFFGGLLMVLMMAACFAFTWPARKYYEKLSRRMNDRDLRSGQGDGDELLGIRIERNQPQTSQPLPYYSPVVAQPVSDRQTYSRGAVRGYQATSASNRNKRRTRNDVIFDDRRRDSRNVERRRIIKQQTSQRRGSLVDSISIAKTVIDGHSKNRQFEKKASERRRVIKQSTSDFGKRPRSMSFFEELQTGRSVILPSEDYQHSVERSKDRRHTIKDRSSRKMRQTLTEEIGDAKKVIVDSERKFEIPPAVVAEMTNGQMPRTCESYSYSDILQLPFFKEERYAAYAKNAAQNRDAASSESDGYKAAWDQA